MKNTWRTLFGLELAAFGIVARRLALVTVSVLLVHSLYGMVESGSPPKELRAERFIVSDSTGKARVDLSMDSRENGRIRLFGSDGSTVLSLVDSGFGCATVTLGTGDSFMMLVGGPSARAGGPNANTVLLTGGEKEKGRFTLAFKEGEGPSITMIDNEGKEVVRLPGGSPAK